jgi:hypothetical protein
MKPTGRIRCWFEAGCSIRWHDAVDTPCEENGARSGRPIGNRPRRIKILPHSPHPVVRLPDPDHSYSPIVSAVWEAAET